jgi:hypothetical protein
MTNQINYLLDSVRVGGILGVTIQSNDSGVVLCQLGQSSSVGEASRNHFTHFVGRRCGKTEIINVDHWCVIEGLENFRGTSGSAGLHLLFDGSDNFISLSTKRLSMPITLIRNGRELVTLESLGQDGSGFANGSRRFIESLEKTFYLHFVTGNTILYE